MDALELRGRQRGLRRNVPDACDDFKKLAEAAKAIPSRATRAYRLQGEVLESTGTRQDLDEARRRLDAGLTWINGAGSLQQIEWFEKGLLLKALSRVQTERGRLPNAKAHLGNAAKCFSHVDTEDGRRQGAEIQKMLAALAPPPAADDSPASLWQRFKRWFRKPFG
jgi:hypothetical protein